MNPTSEKPSQALELPGCHFELTARREVLMTAIDFMADSSYTRIADLS
jgi:hypothetical protein